MINHICELIDIPFIIYTSLQTVVTQWGSSEAFAVEVVPAIAPASLRHVYDVDAQFNGSLAEALMAVAKATVTDAGATVMLGAKEYAVTDHLLVPAGTSIKGHGSDVTVLTFTLAAPKRGEPAAAFEMSSNTSLSDFGVVIAPETTHSELVVVDFNGKIGLVAQRLSIVMKQANVGMAFQIQATGFEVLDNNLTQSGNCSRSEARVIYLHQAEHGRVAGNRVQWNCAAFASDISDNVVLEDNSFTCIAEGPINGGTFLATYDLYRHASSKWWAVSRNNFSRPLDSSSDSWQFHETLTTDAPHSYNMGYVQQSLTVNGTAAVMLGSRMVPPAGATLVALGGSGAGQTRLVTGKLPPPYVNTYTIKSAFDGWLEPQKTMVAALPTAAQKLIVGNTFTGTSVVQWFGDTILGVHADNTFTRCNARTGIGGLELGGALQVGALCYKGAPGQVFFTEYLGNTMIDSDGMALVDNFDNTQMNDCASRGWFPGPWIQWATSRRNSFSGISALAKYDANATKSTPRCGAFVLRAMKGYNSTDVIAEDTTFGCPAGMLPGGYDVVGCTHCAIRD